MTDTELKLAPKDYLFINKANAEETKIYNMLVDRLNISQVSVKIKTTELLEQLGKEATDDNIVDLIETLFKIAKLFTFYKWNNKGNFSLINVIQKLEMTDDTVFVWFSEAFFRENN